jgi:hypothetical protein
MKKWNRKTEDFLFLSKQTRQIQANSVNIFLTHFSIKISPESLFKHIFPSTEKMFSPAGIGKSTKYLRCRRAGLTLSCLPICLVTRFLEPEVGVVSLLDWFESLLDWFVSLLDWFVSLLEWNFVTISVEVLSPSAITYKFLVLQSCR